MDFSGQSYKPLTSPKRKICWILVDLKILPSSPMWSEGKDRALVNIVMPAFSVEEAKNRLMNELSKYGYIFRYVDDFQRFENVSWVSAEDRSLYKTLANQAWETGQIQFGKFYFYSADENE